MKIYSVRELVAYLPRIIKVISVYLLVGGLTACVSTTGRNDPTDYDKALDSHIELASGYLKKRNRESAKHHVKKAFAINSRSAGAHNVQALIYELEGEMELADKHFRKALKDRSYTMGRYNYAGYLLRRKRFDECYEQFGKVADVVDYSGRAKAMSLMGICAKKLGKLDRARAVFKHAVIIDPRQAIALIELADAEFQNKEYQLAKRYLDQFERVSAKTARSLWLGIRIEQIFENKDKEASYVLQLKNLHPYSNEYLEYKRSVSQK